MNFDSRRSIVVQALSHAPKHASNNIQMNFQQLQLVFFHPFSSNNGLLRGAKERKRYRANDEIYLTRSSRFARERLWNWFSESAAKVPNVGTSSVCWCDAMGNKCRFVVKILLEMREKNIVKFTHKTFPFKTQHRCCLLLTMSWKSFIFCCCGIYLHDGMSRVGFPRI